VRFQESFWHRTLFVFGSIFIFLACQPKIFLDHKNDFNDLFERQPDLYLKVMNKKGKVKNPIFFTI